MTYFSGFSLKGEESIFEAFLSPSKHSVAGFSYGAQQAFDYAYGSTERVDKLTLLSPAFFQTQKDSFIRAQLRYFDRDKKAYIEKFLDNVLYPSKKSLSKYLSVGTKEELQILLSYKWNADKINTLLQRGTVIEVVFGEKDKIIPSMDAQHFFSMTTNYICKDAGHLLQKR